MRSVVSAAFRAGVMGFVMGTPLALEWPLPLAGALTHDLRPDVEAERNPRPRGRVTPAGLRMGGKPQLVRKIFVESSPRALRMGERTGRGRSGGMTLPVAHHQRLCSDEMRFRSGSGGAPFPPCLRRTSCITVRLLPQAAPCGGEWQGYGRLTRGAAGSNGGPTMTNAIRRVPHCSHWGTYTILVDGGSIVGVEPLSLIHI